VFVNDSQCVAVRVYPDRDDSVGVSFRSPGTQNSLARRWVAWERGFGVLRFLQVPVFLAAGSWAVVLELPSACRERQALVMHKRLLRFGMLTRWLSPSSQSLIPMRGAEGS
jgi:hypothetical protein